MRVPASFFVRARARFGVAGALAVAFVLVFGPSVYAQFARQTGTTGRFGTGYGYGYGDGYGWDGGNDAGYRYGETTPDERAYGFGYGYLIEDGDGNGQSSYDGDSNRFDIPSESFDRVFSAGLAYPSSTVASSLSITFAENVRVTDGSNNEAVIDRGSTWLDSDEGLIDFSGLLMRDSVSTDGLTETVRAATEIGLTDHRLYISSGFSLYMRVSSAFNGQTLAVYRKTAVTDWEHTADCTITDGFCSFGEHTPGAFAVTGGRVTGGSSSAGTYGGSSESSASETESTSEDATETDEASETVGDTEGTEEASDAVDGASDDAAGSVTEDAEGRRVAVSAGESAPSPYTGETEDVSAVEAGWYVRGMSSPAVYWIDADLHRHPFWDAQTFFTWADSWDEVVWVTDATLPSLPIDSAILPRPGSVLVKIQSEAKVYAVEADADGNAVLRWISTEDVGVALYGADWADFVIDVEPTIFVKYAVGDDMSADDVVDRSLLRTRASLAERVASSR